MTVALGSRAIAALGRSFSPSLVLDLSGSELTVATKVRGVRLTLAIGLSSREGSIEVNVTRASAFGLGLFGTIRRGVNATLVAQAAGLPGLSLKPNARGNLTFSAPGLAFEAITVAGNTLTVVIETDQPPI